MPEPRPQENRDEFIERCIPIVLRDETAEDQDQAVAICNSMWEEASKEQDKMTDKMERKTFSGLVTKADEAQGIIEAIFAVFGNIDQGEDVIHPGAFTKTFAERGGKVRVLDNHRTDTVNAAIGKVLMLKEVSREELPSELLAQHPEATGGAFARVQMLMETPEGRGAFIRLKEKVVDEWSFGYDALDVDFSQAMKDGQEIRVRNLRTLRLYEISPVLFGMNEATTTVSAKDMMTDEMIADIIVDVPGIIETEVDNAFMKTVSGATNPPIAAADKAVAREVENKAINLSQRVEDIIVTFYAKFPDVHNPNHGMHVVYWVKQVWDEFLIVEQEGTLGRRMWKIAYSIDESDVIEFSQQSDWMEVTIAFVPIAPVEIVKNYNLTMQVATDKQDDEQAGPDEPLHPTRSGTVGPPTSSVLDELALLELEIEQLEESYDCEE